MAALPFSGPQLASIGTGLGLVFGGEQHALGSLEGRHRAQCINPRIDPVKHGLMSEPVFHAAHLEGGASAFEELLSQDADTLVVDRADVLTAHIGPSSR